MMRISTLTGLVPPTRSISRSWMARSSFACRRASISLISSSSSVPPLASSNLPTRRAMAPVNAPFSWPNSSDSRRFSGMGAQQFGLEPRIHFADFIEQQGAAIGFFEFADATRYGARERAFLMAEQFGFQKIFRDGGAAIWPGAAHPFR